MGTCSRRRPQYLHQDIEHPALGSWLQSRENSRFCDASIGTKQKTSAGPMSHRRHPSDSVVSSFDKREKVQILKRLVSVLISGRGRNQERENGDYAAFIITLCKYICPLSPFPGSRQSDWRIRKYLFSAPLWSYFLFVDALERRNTRIEECGSHGRRLVVRRNLSPRDLDDLLPVFSEARPSSVIPHD